MNKYSIRAFICAGSLLISKAAFAQMPMVDLDPEKVRGLTLEQLMGLSVTSLAGTEREWFTTPAAMYVITGDEIRRSGHRSLAEALRLAPGVFVGQVNSQAYSIGMRGFTGGLANKTLVLIDGRSVYDPLFSGTFWNVQDVLLEDVDRIEVIRGPGPTLWGANAVNGVINVLTKSAKQTQGWFIEAGGGTYERAFGSVRYGGRIDDHSWFRVWGKWFERDHLVQSDGSSAHDDWDMWRGGFRYDREADDNITLTVQGDSYYSDRIGEFIRQFPIPGAHLQFGSEISDVRHSGGNFLFRLSQEELESGWSLQGYYDHTYRLTNVAFEVERDTFDLEWRHRFTPFERHEILWGLGARHTRDETEPGPNVVLDPADRSLDIFSAFIQDTYTIVPDRWFVMAGTKIQHNDYTGVEIQPSVRVWHTPNDRHTFWAAFSRPVRTPSRTEREAALIFQYVDPGLLAGGPPTGTIIPLAVVGSDVESETLRAYELGHRMRFSEAITIDTSVFYNDYDDLIFVPPTIIGAWNNLGWGETYGGEVTVTWRVADNWRLVSAYSFVDVQIHGPIFAQDEGNSPHHMAQLRSYYNLTDDLELNGALYYVDNVPTVNAGDYLRADLGLIWHVNENFDLSVWGLNLLKSQHREFSAVNEVERSFYIMGTLRF